MTAAQAIEEKILREEKARRLYYCGRYGPNSNLADPLWSPFDNDKVPGLHDHRSPYALCLPDSGPNSKFLLYRQREKTPALDPTVTSELQPPPSEFAVPPKSSPVRAATGARSCSSAAAPLEEVALPPPGIGVASLASRGLSRHSVSDGALRLASSRSGRQAASTAQGSRLSLRSRTSVASLRSKISEAVQQEVEREVQRSELKTYFEACEAKRKRNQQKILDMPLHLRPAPNPVDNGCPRNYTTEQVRSLSLPIQMATDPKWSTDLKKMNGKIGLRLEWEKKMSAALSGSIIPELKHMPPKTYLSQPPTPYFKPGEAHLSRSRP